MTERFLRSKTARQVFLLVMISAIVPTVLVFACAVTAVRGYSRAQIERRLDEATRLLGQQLADRLAAQTWQLQRLASEPRPRTGRVPGEAPRPDVDFEWIGVVDADGRVLETLQGSRRRSSGSSARPVPRSRRSIRPARNRSCRSSPRRRLTTPRGGSSGGSRPRRCSVRWRGPSMTGRWSRCSTRRAAWRARRRRRSRRRSSTPRARRNAPGALAWGDGPTPAWPASGRSSRAATPPCRPGLSCWPSRARRWKCPPRGCGGCCRRCSASRSRRSASWRRSRSGGGSRRSRS